MSQNFDSVVSTSYTGTKRVIGGCCLAPTSGHRKRHSSPLCHVQNAQKFGAVWTSWWESLFSLFFSNSVLWQTNSFLSDLSYLSVALEMVGKFAVTAGTSMMYAYAAELYPTVLRNTATGTCSILSRVGGSAASFLFQLGESTCLHW